jgi:hypothetical protein
MLVLVMIAALVGGLITTVVLWPFGALIALAGAPLGGSSLALVVVGFLAVRDSCALRSRLRRILEVGKFISSNGSLRDL